MSYKKKYFGTDGIRGPVGEFPINVEFVLKLGWAVGKVLCMQDDGMVLIGKDTRISGYMFESALEAGLSAAGIDVYLLGPIPTPAIAYLTRTLRAQIGIVISASHNTFQDNGIKFFSSEGLKLKEDVEESIENLIDKPITTVNTAKIGKVYRLDDALGRYIEFCKSSVPHRTHFKGMKIVLDCANGATYSVAPKVFSELQADVVVINNQPDGLNINENCGSISPETLQSAVLSEKADVGIAFDGDGDRVIMVDHNGEVVDGDELLFIIAKEGFAKKRFSGGVVGTFMSNMGLEVGLKNLNIPFKRTFVGDQHILHALKQEGWDLGGESSGHIICLDMTTTGDGIISALQVLQVMQSQKKTLQELRSQMIKYPQVKINVPCKKNTTVLEDPEIKRAADMAEKKMNGKGRVLLRPSGTEPLIRIMVEGEDEDVIQEIAREIHEIIKEKCDPKA